MTIGIVGYGDIGFQCAKAIKKSLGSRIIAVNRTPSKTSEEYKTYIDSL